MESTARRTGIPWMSSTTETTTPGPEVIRVYCLASAEIAVPAVHQLVADDTIDLVGCGTQPDRPYGRKRRLQPTPVGAALAAAGVAVDKPESVNTAAFRAHVAGLRPEVIVVFAFGQILGSKFLQLPTHECINVHASLLPRFRGASPVHAAIVAGDAVTGITIMQMVRKMDAGPIYKQYRTEIKETENAAELADRLGELAREHIVPAVHNVYHGRWEAQPQDETQACYANKLTKADGFLDFSAPAAALARRIRGYTPWPGAWCLVQPFSPAAPDHGDVGRKEKRIIVTRASALDHDRDATAPGTILQADDHGWSIACGRSRAVARSCW